VILGQSISVYRLAIEQWENGRRSTHRRQLWDILCGEKPKRYCSIDRLVIDDWSKDAAIGNIVSQHHHSTEDQTIRDFKIDRESKQLEFTLVFSDGSTGQFQLQFNGNYLAAFRGYSVVRGAFSKELAAVEYRVSPYTHTLYVPIQAVGLQEWGVKAWDEMVATFGESDQRAAERLLVLWRDRKDGVPTPELKEEPKTEAAVRQMVASMRDAVDAHARRLIEEAKFTEAAATRVSEHFRGMTSSFDRVTEEAVQEFRKNNTNNTSPAEGTGGNRFHITALRFNQAPQAPVDTDGDSVPDSVDQCGATEGGAVVNSAGCSLAQLVPCLGSASGGPWRNHGRYVVTFVQHAQVFQASGLISEEEKDALIADAAASSCGK